VSEIRCEGRVLASGVLVVTSGVAANLPRMHCLILRTIGGCPALGRQLRCPLYPGPVGRTQGMRKESSCSVKPKLSQYTWALGRRDRKGQGFYFDDQHWTVRYLEPNTGDWLEERLVLISPYALVSVDEEREIIATNLTKKQIENSPPADSVVYLYHAIRGPLP